MSIPLALIARTRAFHHTGLKAQAARWHTLLADLLQEGLAQSRSLPRGNLHQAPLAALQDIDGVNKALRLAERLA